MSYTCSDCKNPCMERSREYICTSFVLGEPSDSSLYGFQKSKSEIIGQKSKARKRASECVRKEVEK